MAVKKKSFGTAAKRWEAIGPYYAMFPIRFADSVVEQFTLAGDTVIDPFAGRGTAVFSAASLGRRGLGVEISPVGWVYARSKLNPAPLEKVEARLHEIADLSAEYREKSRCLPKFFRHCYSSSVRCYLLAARDRLDWRRSATDRTLMALLMVYLHGKRGQSLSNQMRQTKAMSPQYAIDWWTEHEHRPPEIDVVQFMLQRLQWRYAKGVISAGGSSVYLGNSLSRLPELERTRSQKDAQKANLLLTSPPYYGVTNYHYDQWLRLWLLGHEPDAYVSRGPYKGRFTHAEQYENLLTKVFRHSAKLLAKDAVVYVRTSSQTFTKLATQQALIDAFPSKNLVEKRRPFRRPTQTMLFGDREPKSGEVDLIMSPR